MSRFDKMPKFELDHNADCADRFRQVHKAYWEMLGHCADEVLALLLWRTAAIFSWVLLGALYLSR